MSMALGGEPLTRGRSEGELAIGLYASAVAVASGHYDALAQGTTPALTPLERAAQALAAAAANSVFPAIVTLCNGARGDAARAVQSAMLALSAARRITRDPRALRRIALSALLVDAGRSRLAGAAAIDLAVFRELPDSLDALVPASSAALGIVSATSRTMEGSTATAFEVAWLERPRLGALYGGQLAPRLSSRLLLATRALIGLIAPDHGETPRSPLLALTRLASDGRADDVVIRLLTETLGALPIGTVVELSTAEWAVVAPAPSLHPLERLRVRILTNPGGRALEHPPLVELAANDSRAAPGRVVRVIEPDEARLNVAQAFFLSRG